MDSVNYENNDKKMESVYSTRIRAGKRRTYFFDVRATRANDYFVTITESRKRFDNNGYDRHKIFIYKEDFNKFIKALSEALDYVKTELMPDFDFDAFNHDEEENAGAFDENRTNTAPTAPRVTSEYTEHVKQTEIVEDETPITITEKKPLEAPDTPASQGDNLSGEEVDKW